MTTLRSVSCDFRCDTIRARKLANTKTQKEIKHNKTFQKESKTQNTKEIKQNETCQKGDRTKIDT